MTQKVTIDGKVALVTGANRGIGKAIAAALLDAGAKKVYAGARDVGSLDDLVDEYGDKLVPIQLDVTNADDVANAAEAAKDVEILVNNAGVAVPGNYMNGTALEGLQGNLDVNVFGLMRVTEAFIQPMSKLESGAIVSISSIAGLANMPGLMSYSISKATVHSAIQGMRAELRNSNVLVMGVYPGPIDTDMAKGFEIEKETPENVAKKIIDGIQSGSEDIFPDPMSEQVGAAYMSSPKELEKQAANF